MKYNTLKVGGLFIMAFCIFFLNACSVETETVENRFNREHVKSINSESNFGAGSTDDEYVILNYVYESEELAEKYGNSFEVENIGGTAEFEERFLWIYKGTGKYFVTIEGDDWAVEVSKSLFGKWEVTSCYPGWELV